MTAPLVIGHRGAPGYRPEHTASSYELAIAMGADAVEPDIVVSKDGVLVVRHENEIGSTTDVSQHPGFASRRTTKDVDGEMLTGWFAEDFTWAELSTLRCRERLPALRPQSAAFDDTEPMLRLSDLVDLVRSAGRARGRRVGLVVEIKHATALGRLGHRLDQLVFDELRGLGGDVPLVIESFESTVLTALRERGLAAEYIYLLAADGHPADLVASLGAAAPTYAQTAAPAGLDALAGRFDGISVDKRMILEPDGAGRATGPSRIVADAHERGLRVFTWTCRPENAFLVPEFRSGADDGAFGRYEEEWAVLRDAEPDGVFADHADLAVAFFRGE
ncbi:glycerophosphodiester phosphodiesterase [Microbacterium sp. Gd 4-13]|uniref:glycerophosphodiester phosphodiesterase family protein n=1 Tax=Microbacterium sp. Gd 4-13 TaxID=2173179 RepID=UPI000D577124|nr:glycerophosphodiester phosphodiesterase family protein [Microbacterium sp. Gd 4-13]PVW05991.1 glycerophosphodiester phosphodiesterase [Microbacterium sp. Gd 4-13]